MTYELSTDERVQILTARLENLETKDLGHRPNYRTWLIRECRRALFNAIGDKETSTCS